MTRLKPDKAEIIRLREAFLKLNKSKDGVLKLEELKEGMEKFDIWHEE